MRFRHCARMAMFGWALIALWAVSAHAEVRLPAIFGDNMVLQRDLPVRIWGWADPGEKITIVAAGQTVAAVAGRSGAWQATLSPLKAGPLPELIVRGSSGNVITLKNVAVGEVWVCSGQSNMEMGLAMCDNAKLEIAAADFPGIRLFQVTKDKGPTPSKDVKGAWAICSPKSITAAGWGGFSGAAYYFGRQLHKELNVPVGLIQTAWGGTPAELWTSRDALESKPELKSLAGQGESSHLYNHMIAPLIPYAIRGVIWYQGEANVGRAAQYQVLFPTMIADWRARWGQGDFPFIFAQIAPYLYDTGNPTRAAELREAQRKTLDASPNTGMAVTLDIASDVRDIHPKNKQDVGRRFARWAMANVYSRPVVYSGPIYKSMTVEGDAVRLRFEHVGGGLVASDGKPLREFTIAGEDRKFVPAAAVIDGDTIVVRSGVVRRPVAVRYAWRDDVVPNLANKEGLPASSFRTDAP